MATGRTSKAERQARQEQARSAAKADFVARLGRLTTFPDAVALVNDSSASPAAREFQSNLGFFLHQFRMPAGASLQERAAYKVLFDRLLESGVIDLTVGDPRDSW